MLNPHEYYRYRSKQKDIFKTDHSLPLLNINKTKAKDLPLHLPQINQKKNNYKFYD